MKKTALIVFILAFAHGVLAQCGSYAGPDETVCVHELPLNFNTPSDTYWTGTGVSSTGNFNPSSGGVYTLQLVTDSESCQDSDERIITVLNSPIVNAGSDQLVCEFEQFQIEASATTENGSIVIWSWSGDVEYLNSTNIPNPIATPEGSSSFNLTVADDAGCFSFDQINLTTSELPNVNAGNDTTVCNSPDPVVLYGSPAGGDWSGPGVSGSQFVSPGVGTHNLEYEYTTPLGCTNTDLLSITVSALPSVNAGSDIELCENEESVALIGYSPSGGTWSGIGVSSDGLINPSGLSGDKILTYTVGSGNCAVHDTRVFLIKDLPEITVSSDYDFCREDDSAFLDDAIPSGGDWLGDIIENPTSGEVNSNVASVNNQVYYVYEDNTTGCIDTALSVVHIREIPQANFELASIACDFQALDIENNSQTGLEYSWLINEVEHSTDETPNILLADHGIYAVKLQVNSSYGCSETSSVQQVEIIGPPNADFSASVLEGCEPLEVDFSNLSQGEYLVYNWNFDGTLSSIPQPTTINFGDVSELTNHDISLTVSNSCGTDFASEIVVSKALPTADFYLETSTLCSPVYTEFFNTSSANSSTFVWDLGDGASENAAVPELKIYTTEDLSESFEIVLTATNECGSSSKVESLTVLPNPVTAGFSVSQSEFCLPAEISFNDSSSGANSIIYDFNGTLVNDVNAVHNYLSSGEYEVFQYATDGCGFDTSSVILTVYPEPIATISMSSVAVCSGLPISFSTEGEEVENYQWTFGSLGTSASSNPTVNFSQTGPEEIQLSAYTQEHNCLVELTELVDIYPLPLIDYTLNSLQGCVPFELVIENLSSEANLFNWSINDFTSEASSPVFNLTEPGVYSLAVSATNIYGCEANSTNNNVFILNDTPLADFTFNPSDAHILTSPNILFESLSQGVDTYQWSFGDGEFSEEVNPEHLYSSAGTFFVSLTVANNYGCESSLMQEVFIKDELAVFVPNSFSPNGDGLNDVFLPNIKGSNYTNYHFYIFNRWGDVVFETIDPQAGWIGNIKGGDHFASNGAYTWRVSVQLDNGEGNEVFQGVVSIFR